MTMISSSYPQKLHSFKIYKYDLESFDYSVRITAPMISMCWRVTEPPTFSIHLWGSVPQEDMYIYEHLPWKWRLNINDTRAKSVLSGAPRIFAFTRHYMFSCHFSMNSEGRAVEPLENWKWQSCCRMVELWNERPQCGAIFSPYSHTTSETVHERITFTINASFLTEKRVFFKNKAKCWRGEGNRGECASGFRDVNRRWKLRHRRHPNIGRPMPSGAHQPCHQCKWIS